MVCPMSSEWYDSITGFCYPNDTKELRSIIEDYVANAKPQNERKKYIESGGWKSRSGGRDLPNGGNRVSESISNDSISFTMEYTKQSWIEVSKILGVIAEFNGTVGAHQMDGLKYRFNI